MADSTQASLKKFYQLGLQQAPEQAFKQFFKAKGAPGGGPFSTSALNFLGAPAGEGFFLAPFLQPGAFGGTNALEKLGSFTMPKFLEGFGSTAGGFGVPTAQQVFGGLKDAGGLFGKTGGNLAQQAIADVLNKPDSNQAIFNMLSNPLVGQAGGLFNNAIQALLSRAFAKFQEKDPSLSFLQALMGGTAGTEFGGFGF